MASSSTCTVHPALPSLFVLSLPRSLSSHVHQACCAALGLAAPAWTSDGEVMNMDRCTLVHAVDHAARKFTLPGHGEGFARAAAFLDDVVHPQGRCYKDVVQPFVVAAWLARHPEVRVLKIVPDLAHVADAMLRRNWVYPTVAADRGGDLAGRLVAGLARAAGAQARVPGETVAFDDLMDSAAPLTAALGRLYPARPVRLPDRGPEWASTREGVLARRREDGYRRLSGLVAAMQARADAA